jgi:hypothetical protein
MLLLQINEKIDLGPVEFLEVHIVSKLKKVQVCFHPTKNVTINFCDATQK